MGEETQEVSIDEIGKSQRFAELQKKLNYTSNRARSEERLRRVRESKTNICIDVNEGIARIDAAVDEMVEILISKGFDLDDLNTPFQNMYYQIGKIQAVIE